MGGVDVDGAAPDGAAGSGCCRAAAVEGRWLHDRVPLPPVGRDDSRQNVLVGPVLARAVVLRRALLDADLADEDQALELFVGPGASSTRLRADIFRIQAQGGVEDGLDPAVANLDGLGVIGAFDDPIFPKLSLCEFAVDHDEFECQHLAAAVFAALEHAVFARTAALNVQAQGGDGVRRDELEVPRWRGVGVVVGHGCLLSGLSGLLG